MMAKSQFIDNMNSFPIVKNRKGVKVALSNARTAKIKICALESARQALGYRYRVSAWSGGSETVCTFARLPRAQRSFALYCARHYDHVILIDVETGELLDSFDNE